MPDEATVKEPTAEELQAETERLQQQANEHRAAVIRRNHELAAEVEALRKAASKDRGCPACGSPLHEHCGLPAHHGGPKVERD